MSWSSKDILYLVELIIYLGLTPCVAFSAFKHGRRSVLGHIYLFGFCSLRVVADAMIVSNRNATPSTSALIINSIGLSPLLLAILGFVGEAHAYTGQDEKSSKSTTVRSLVSFILHSTVLAGVVLLATGMANAYSGETAPAEQRTGRTNARIGALILLLGWVLITARGVFVFRATKEGARHGIKQPRLLATEILVALPFVGIRTIYTVIEIYNINDSPTLASFAMVFFLLFLSQLIPVLILLVALFLTRNIKDQAIDQQSTLVSEDYGPREGSYQNGRGSPNENNPLNSLSLAQ